MNRLRIVEYSPAPHQSSHDRAPSVGASPERLSRSYSSSLRLPLSSTLEARARLHRYVVLAYSTPCSATLARLALTFRTASQLRPSIALATPLQRSLSSQGRSDDDELDDDNDELELRQLKLQDATTLASLPAELLLHILDYAAPSALYSPQEATRRYSWLRAVALTARCWRAPAQATLFSSISIIKPSQASRWLASPLLGVYATRELDLAGVHAGEGLSGTTAARVLSKAIGVRWLRLQDFKRLSSRLFMLESLSGESETVGESSGDDADPSRRRPSHARPSNSVPR